MCIQKSVGPNSPNEFEDVKVVQILLNLNQTRSGGATLSTDGVFGSNTENAIAAFQRTVMGSAAPDSRVDPNGATLRELCAGIPDGFSDLKLRAIMPSARESDIAKYFPQLLPTMVTNEIDSALRQAHFLAQIGHESAALRFSEELASGDAYEGRADLGNTQPGDGPRFKGRGLIQLTGRANYTKYGIAKGRDFLEGDNPKLIATDPQLAVDVACWFWNVHHLNDVADADDAEKLTRRINGGLNGLESRLAYLARSKAFLRVASE